MAEGFAATREIYVWQRQMGAEVAAALREFSPQVDGVCLLAAEVSWRRGRMEIVRTATDLALVRGLGRPVGLAVRIGPFGGHFAADDATAKQLTRVVGRLLAEAKWAGVEVAELQVDFDCAEAKLAGYGRWLDALRPVMGRTRLVFTALPAWLKRSEFAELARQADGFVLQVHSLEKPTGPETPFALCDPGRALAWARQAGAAGVPFRVALPTYGYGLIFDAEGKFRSLNAEGDGGPVPAGGRRRVVRADAVAMARLAKLLATEPPPHCTGVVWFRMPVAGDRLNWAAPTLATVLRGEIPAARVEIAVRWTEPGLAEIVAVNSGQTTEAPPPSVHLRWKRGARAVAADGLGGFRLEMREGTAQAIVRAAGVPADATLAPGQRTTLAWLRFSHEVSIDVSLPASP